MGFQACGWDTWDQLKAKWSPCFRGQYFPATLTSGPSSPQTKLKPKRVKALYNCVADNPDELTFSEGDVIIVDGEEDQEWWVSRGWSWHRSGRGRADPDHLA